MLQVSADRAALVKRIVAEHQHGSTAGICFLIRYSAAVADATNKMQIASALTADMHGLVVCPLSEADCQRLVTLLSCVSLSMCTAFLEELFSTLSCQVCLKTIALRTAAVRALKCTRAKCYAPCCKQTPVCLAFRPQQRRGSSNTILAYTLLLLTAYVGNLT